MLAPIEVYRVEDYWTEGGARHFTDARLAAKYAGEVRARRDTCSPGRLTIKPLLIRNEKELLRALDGASGFPDIRAGSNATS